MNQLTITLVHPKHGRTTVSADQWAGNGHAGWDEATARKHGWVPEGDAEAKAKADAEAKAKADAEAKAQSNDADGDGKPDKTGKRK